MSGQTPSIGKNRTGIGAARERADRMLDGMHEFGPTSHEDGHDVLERRVRYAREGHRIGSIPAVGIDGREADASHAPLLDKMGARLAFERVGTRLYDALLSKHDAFGAFDGGPTRGDLEDIRGEEHDHFLLLERAIKDLGGDPTAVTPSADLQLTVGQGVPSAILDPRTTLLESLEAVLVAELVDEASWETLIDLAGAHGRVELAEEFARAHATEEEHLRKVKRWIAAGQGRADG